MWAAYLLTALLCLQINLVVALDTDCTVDTDCPTGMACVHIKYRAYGTSQVRAKCTVKNVCRGSSTGNCPSFNSPTAPGGMLATQCVLVNTTRLRNINCCGGDWKGNITQRRLAGNDTNSNTNPPNTSGGSTPLDSNDCFQCYTDLTNKKGTTFYGGQFFCVPNDECLSSSAFPFACSSGNLCTSRPGELCNNHGTCFPKDIHDPKSSYGCACNVGFAGEQCEKVISNACLFDCGDGNTKGECIDNKCRCKPGWTGLQCEKCMTDLACGGVCDVTTGSCSCPLTAMFNYALTANICHQEGSKAVDINACASVTCGENGFCTAGKCYCSTGCTGTVCTQCVDEKCSTCNPNESSSIHSTTWIVLSLLGSIIFL